VQVDPIKPKLKPPGTKRVKLESDVLLSNIAFKLHLRHYTKVPLIDSLCGVTLTIPTLDGRVSPYCQTFNWHLNV